MDKSNFAVYNPYGKPVPELPVIYGFNAGGDPGSLAGYLIAQDGVVLGSHLCSEEGFMYGDLGILAGTREDRHETFREHYPDGYRMDFVPLEEASTHRGLREAMVKNHGCECGVDH